MRSNRMNAPAACYHFSIFNGSFLYQRTKPPQGNVLFMNLLGKALTPRACMGDAASIWWVPGSSDDFYCPQNPTLWLWFARALSPEQQQTTRTTIVCCCQTLHGRCKLLVKSRAWSSRCCGLASLILFWGHPWILLVRLRLWTAPSSSLAKKSPTKWC